MSICTTADSFSSSTLSVCESTIQLAFCTWSKKNSPKFFIYILHFCASTTVQKALSLLSGKFALSTALITSESLPTPDGSIIILLGEYSSYTFLSALEKSPTKEQQIQPEFISVIWIPASCKKPPSMPISPNSFSMSTSFSPLYASPINFLISVVLPAPKKPEKISIFVILSPFVFSFIYRKITVFKRILLFNCVKTPSCRP